MSCLTKLRQRNKYSRDFQPFGHRPDCSELLPEGVILLHCAISQTLTNQLHLHMTSSILAVKNMVCHRCVMSVEDILKRESIPFHQVLVGEIHLCDKLSDKQRQALQDKLENIGLELIDSRMGGLIEKIKQLVIKKARNEVDESEKKIKLSK